MNCSTFQDQLSDYLEAALDPRAKAECAAHRLVCRECRALYNEVRAAMTATGELAEAHDIIDSVEPHALTTRILAATTPGKMLSCGEFDQLIALYFDGVLLAPAFQTFQNHFDQCRQCRRLLAGIEDAVSLCHEAKQETLAVSADLQDRIFAATTGTKNTTRWRASFVAWWAALATPQWAVALLIVAAALTLLNARFANVDEFKAEAQVGAERLRRGLQANSRQARAQINQTAVRFEALLETPPAYAPFGVPAAQPLVNRQQPPVLNNQQRGAALPVATVNEYHTFIKLARNLNLPTRVFESLHGREITGESRSSREVLNLRACE